MSRAVSGVRLNPTDFYPTPQWCYENLDIDLSQFSSAHEPCAGDHRIVNWLSTYMPTTYSEITEGKDFFEWNDNVDLIFTNPPFSLAQEFIDHSIAHANTVIMLLRLNFLGSIKRHDWWKRNSPTALHILSKRPSFTGTGTDATEYCWFIWDKTNRIPPGISFVPPPTKAQTDYSNASAKAVLKQ